MRFLRLAVISGPVLAIAGTAVLAAGPLQWGRVADLPAGIAAVATSSSVPSEVIAAGATIYLSSDAGATWQGLSGLAGPVTAVAISPVSAAVALAAGPQGILRSGDAGRTWQGGSGGLPAEAITSLALDPASAAVAFAGTVRHGVWRSGDGGATWQRAGRSPDVAVRSLLIDPAHPSRVVAATDSGMLVTSDAGGTWNAIGLIPGSPRALSLGGEFVSGLLFAGTTAGIYRSQDGGQSWDAIGGVTAPTGPIPSLAFHAQSGQELLASTAGGPVMTSVDLGASWVASSGWPAGSASVLAYLPLLEPVALGASSQGGMYRIGEVLSKLTNPGINPGAFPAPSVPPGGLHVDRTVSADDGEGLLTLLLVVAAVVAGLGVAAFWWRRRLAGL